MLKKPWVLPAVLSSVIVILAAIVVALLVFMKNQPLQKRGVEPLVDLDAMEPDSSRWGLNFPNQYSTYLETGTNTTQTTYGGSNPSSKLEADPRLVTLFAGYGFSIEYNEDRGHLNALEDVRKIKRINEKSPATCYSCKSSDNPVLWDEMGMETYDAKLFSAMTPMISQSIGCANCHEAGTMRLVVTNPALDEALQTQGVDWRTLTRQEMRTVVCANCHVEYYFQGDGKLLTFPWENGTRVEAIEAYYQAANFTDWTHTESETPLIKIQHPEYELFTAGSTHYAAGVSCADCHMPYTRDGAIKFSTHDVHSPLLEPANSCGACHTDVGYVTGRVAEIQDQVHATLIATEDAILQAIDAISAAAADPGADPALIETARQLHRSAQIRWDFIAAENSMGFHNPEEALRILAAATDLARQAQLQAVLASP
ncbi:MAG TPA: ammonia-forming cytochrome c nitrite reductase subunit c552 [Anaerolineaceae bacterium]|nr:ammonia-forming cytochrome c nitrite reductase subunit c552 [Anaerolineaceae bacterium]